jgi:hypothetical protein
MQLREKNAMVRGDLIWRKSSERGSPPERWTMVAAAQNLVRGRGLRARDLPNKFAGGRGSCLGFFCGERRSRAWKREKGCSVASQAEAEKGNKKWGAGGPMCCHLEKEEGGGV